MRFTVKLPRLAETVDEVLVVAWRVAIGDVVEAGEDLVDCETDKATVSVPAPMRGTVVELLVDVETEIPTGTPLVVMESGDG